jgi:hypothetical protein
MSRVIATLALALIATLALAVPAHGQGSSVTRDQYVDPVSQFEAGLGEAGDPADPDGSGDPSAVGSLPFTGLDLALMGAAAAGLVAAGFAMRRHAARGESS